MSVVNNNLLLTADAAASAYQVQRSIRLNTPDSAYVNRTFGTPTTQGTFTLAMWVKRAALDTAQSLFGVSTNHSFGFTTGNALNLTFGGTSALTTTAVFRDTSAWYHIVWTQSGTSHTVYVNGTSQGTATATSSVFNTAVAHQVGASNTANYFNGYLAEIYFIDGQALTPSSFTETNATTGQLVPKAYTGTYGTNGFRLNFSDNSAATLYTLGADSRTDGALNGNNGTLVNGPTYSSANGGSIVFDGTNDYVAGPTFTGLGLSSRTVDVWFQIRSLSLSGSKRILSLVADDTATDAPALIFGYTTSLSSLDVGFGGAPYNGYVSNISFTLSTWINLTATVTGNNIVIYKNGISIGTATNSGAVGSNPILYLGRYNNFYNQYGDIIISNAKIYNRALSAAEITQNYNALVGRFGGTSTGSIVTDGMVLNLDAGNTASYPGTGTTWTDISLRKNNWTPNNLSVTAGAGNDSLTDTPTSYGTDTGAGGEVRGNYATLNPLVVSSGVTYSNGNLDITGNSHQGQCLSTISVSSGKWYYETTLSTFTTGDPLYGISRSDASGSNYPGQVSTSYSVYSFSGNTFIQKVNNGAFTNTNTAKAVQGDVIGIAFDLDSGKFWVSKNGTWIDSGNPSAGTNPLFSSISGTYVAAIRCSGASSGSVTNSSNFGQRPFAYPLSGFKALCDTNIAEGTITTSGTFTGNASADGPFVYLNGVPTAMTINSNAVTFATHADKLANGFKVRSSSGSYNTAGSNTYSITTTGAKFKYARAQPNP